MPPEVQHNLDAIRSLCREYGVARLDLFGSAARDDFDPAHSDFDFLVEYLPNADLGSWLARFFELEERLAALLGRPVDLVMAGAVRNPYIMRSINQDRHLLYAA